MNVADKDRLIKLIGMLGSAHAGERDNAAVFIQKMATANKMTVTELMTSVNGKGADRVIYKDRVVYKDRIVEKVVVKEVIRDRAPDPEPAFTDVDSPLIARLRQVAAKPAIAKRVLSAWELEFVTDVSQRYEYDTHLSDRQLRVVEKVLVKASRLFTW